MVRLLPQATFISAPTEEDRLAFSVHPGAELYYGEDDPLFIVDYAERLALGVTTNAFLASGLCRRGSGWRTPQEPRGPLQSRDRRACFAGGACRNRCGLRGDPARLFAIFERVIVDLDNDRIEERSLLSFSFAWQAAASTLNHRQLLRGRTGPPILMPAHSRADHA